jgi:hypothetical protein
VELELWVHDAITGDEITQVHPTEERASWRTNLGGTGTCTWAFQTDDPDTGMNGARIRSLFQPNARLLALRFGTAVLGAWKVDDWDYAYDTASLVVSGVELVRSESKWRMTYGLNEYELGTLSVTNRSYSGAVRAILSRFKDRSPAWNYPIDLPADGAGTFTQTWEFWKKFTIEDLLAQIEAEGVEIFFRPYLTASRQLRYETIVSPRATSGASAFHLQADDTPLGGVHYKVSGAEQITGGQGLGQGTGQDQAVAYAGAPPYPIPIRDVKRTFADLTGTRLQAATDAWYAEAKNPVVQWTVGTFTASDEYPPTHAVTGRAWTLHSTKHPVIPDGPHALRVIAASGTFGAQITTEVQSAQ